VNRTRHNIAANVAGRIVGVISFYLFVPIYLRQLGPEAYGVVGFFTVMLGVLAIADLGLTSTLSREMARLGASADLVTDRRDLVRTLEWLYLGVSLLIGVLVIALAPWIAAHWLQARALPNPELVEALRWMGLAIALQLPTSFYFGGLLGLERMVTANALQIAWGLLRSGGAALALFLVAPTLRVFFVTVTAANLLYLVAGRAACWQSIGQGGTPHFRRSLLAATWRYSAGMAAMSVMSSLLSQLDKLVVSRRLPLDTFAHYSVAGMLAQAPVIVAIAISTALFPRFTALAAGGATPSLRRVYHTGCQLVSVVALPLGLTLAAFAGEVLRFWSRSEATAATAAGAATLLLVGSTALALQLVPFQLALAHGWVGLNLRLSIASLIVMPPALELLVSRFGLAGAAWAWLGLNVLTLPVLVWGLHRRVMPGATREWLFADVGPPLAATLAVLAAARWLAPHAASPRTAFFAAGLAGLAALLAAALVSPAGRTWLRGRRALPEAS
jgi:O-antigen/teichoic acid export membrane protein